MPISDYLNQTASLVTRGQWALYDDTAEDLLILGGAPLTVFRVSVDVSGGSSNTGTVTITGSLDGAAKTETLTFTSARTKNSSITVDTITSITTTGFSDEGTVPDITVTCIDSTGSPIMAESASTISCRLTDKSTRYMLDADKSTRYMWDGVWTASDSTCYALPSASPGINSVIRYDDIDYIVRTIKTHRTRSGVADHLEMALDRLAGVAIVGGPILVNPYMAQYDADEDGIVDAASSAAFLKVAASAITQYDVVALAPSTGRVVPARADSSDTMPAIGIAQSTVAEGESVQVRFMGESNIRTSGDLTVDGAVFLSAVGAGLVSQNAPTDAGTYTQRLGAASGSGTIILQIGQPIYRRPP